MKYTGYAAKILAAEHNELATQFEGTEYAAMFQATADGWLALAMTHEDDEEITDFE